MVARLAVGLDAEPEHLEGGVRLGHTPFVAPLAYLHRVYPPLASVELTELEDAIGRPVGRYGNFLLGVGNGARLFNLSLFGFVEQLSREVNGLGQPISLRYGNEVERPSGLADDELVIGGQVGWSSRGSFVLHASGAVSLVHPEDAADVAARWPTLDAMLSAELDRLSALHDRSGRAIVGSTVLMHPEGRRWETSAEPEPKGRALGPSGRRAKWSWRRRR